MAEKNENARLEAFCDGVFAIAITLLVLEIKIPPLESIHSNKELMHELVSDWPSWFGFVMSFIIIFIAWVNHHNAFKLINKTSAAFTFANGFLLLTVVVMPFTTGLMADYLRSEFAQIGVSAYCLTILVHNVAWVMIGWTVLHHDLARDSASRTVLSNAVIRYSHYAFFLYLSFSILSFWFPITAVVLMSASWIIWIVTGIVLNPGKQGLL